MGQGVCAPRVVSTHGMLHVTESYYNMLLFGLLKVWVLWLMLLNVIVIIGTVS